MAFLLTARVESDDEEPLVPGSIKVDCFGECGGLVWISPALVSQYEAGSHAICLGCLNSRVKGMAGEN